MATIVMKLIIDIDPRDLEAFLADVEEITLKYGDRPAPHLRAAHATEIKRATDAFVACMDLRAV